MSKLHPLKKNNIHVKKHATEEETESQVIEERY